jgi:hypothetical protein
MVLNDTFDHRIQFTGQMCNRLAPFVELHHLSYPCTAAMSAAVALETLNGNSIKHSLNEEKKSVT